ncbi:MAG: NPCBM/NEW2 domain-containing protein [Rubripirellula sp.]|nr:NPCBM/NEW2 domain-containing protein [Rubripirellula sp.]
MPNLYAAEWLLQIVQAITLAIFPVVVETSDGAKIRGDFKGITSNTLLIAANGSVQELPFNKLASMQRMEFTPKVPPAKQVALSNGSRIYSGELKFDDAGVLIEPRRQPSLRTPVKKVHTIRFRKSSPETDAQWLGLSNTENNRDVLVIRRPGNRLDPQQGIVLSIDETTVKFDLDGTEIDAPINQLEGVIFGGIKEIDETPPIRITDIYGSSWALTGNEPNEGDKPIQIQLDDNLQHAIPLEQIARIDWTSGIRMLAQEKATASQYNSYVATNVDPTLLNRFFGPKLKSRTDLVLNGGSKIEYRLPPQFRKFAGTVQRNETSGVTGKVTVNIKFDDKVVWSESLGDAKPRGFELDTNGARRVALEVDHGGDGDVGDNIRFLSPRLLK